VLAMEQSLNSAADAAKRMDDAKGKALALNRVAEALGRAERAAESRSLLREVSRRPTRISEPRPKSRVLTRMAYTYGKHLNSRTSPPVTWKNSEEIADGISRPEGKIDALLEIAFTCHECDGGPGEGLSDKSLAAARGLEDSRKRADAVASSAATLSKMNKADETRPRSRKLKSWSVRFRDPMSPRGTPGCI